MNIDILEKAATAHPGPDFAQKIVRLIDLTSLSGDESHERIQLLAKKALHYQTAAVCVYPSCLEAAKEVLDGSDVRLATVVNFPEGSDDIELAVQQTAKAIELGAEEIDLVVPYQSALEGDIGICGEMTAAVKEVCGPSVLLKTILETGELEKPDLITMVARSVIVGGTDFLKTSTGKTPTGATLSAAHAMLETIAEAGNRIGIKISGGVRTAKDAATYACLIEHYLAEDAYSSAKVRVGASSLLDDLFPS